MVIMSNTSRREQNRERSTHREGKELRNNERESHEDHPFSFVFFILFFPSFILSHSLSLALYDSAFLLDDDREVETRDVKKHTHTHISFYEFSIETKLSSSASHSLSLFHRLEAHTLSFSV